MSSDKPTWDKKMDISYEERLKQPIYMPHPAIPLLYKLLSNQIGEEKALQQVQKTISEYYAKEAKEILEKNPINKLQDYIDMFASFESDFMKNTFIYEVLESTERKHDFNVTFCPYAIVFREMGSPELGYAWWCNNDFVYIDTVGPKVKLVRTKTLMQGDDCCDFRYSWEEY